MQTLTLDRDGALPAWFQYVEGWGMTVGRHGRVVQPRTVDEIVRAFEEAATDRVALTLRGTGNSYGDASVPAEGRVLDVSRMDRILDFDPATGVASLEAGVTIERLWKTILPHGYWPRVVSGTMRPTMAGALAANIHGKNNFKVGTLGDSCREFDLVLPTGEVRTCSRTENADLFHAAIGGFGLLGCFSRIVLETHRVHSGDLRVTAISTRTLGEMMDRFREHRGDADYLVGWIDAFPGGRSDGRGLIHRADYLEPGEDRDPESTLALEHQQLPETILKVFPKSQVWRILRLFNHDLGMRTVNAVKVRSGQLEAWRRPYLQSHAAFAFLLDYVPNWKWAYGRTPAGRPAHGLLQFQPFLPDETAHDTFLQIFALCRRAGHVPYLAVLKRHRPDPFWLTHALDGWSMGMDFKVAPASRASLLELCDRLIELVLEAGGRFYFAKDQLLGRHQTARFLPADRLAAFRRLKTECDPEELLDGALWRRTLSDGP